MLSHCPVFTSLLGLAIRHKEFQKDAIKIVRVPSKMWVDFTHILIQMKGVTGAKPCFINFFLFQNINSTPTSVSKSKQNVWRFCICRALARYLEYHCWHSNFAIAAQVGHFAGGYSEYQG